ncbi:type III PLP-dependent enzyme domain-containing protein [Algoriphagus namhaensis]
MQTELEQDTLPLLTPLANPWVKSLLGNKCLLQSMVKEFGSPLNIHHKGSFHQNIQSFQQVAQAHDVELDIFFARKANKCLGFVKEAKRAGIGVDAASLRELTDCLEVGLDPDKIVLTAAIKSKELMELAVDAGVLVTLDNGDEMDLLAAVCEERDKTCPIALRISGFLFEEARPTRFGLPLDQARQILLHEICEGGKYANFRFQGFHFHINGYSTKERSSAICETIALIDELNAYGIQTKFIDIGGGFLVNYLSSESEWTEFHQRLEDSVRGRSKPITHQNDGLGMKYYRGELIGSPHVYPYFNRRPKEKFLQEILRHPFDKTQKIYEALNARKLALRIEPGRSLLDQTGITLAEVVFRKVSNQGENYVGLHMNRTQLKSSSEDFLVDPIYIPLQDEYEEDSYDCFFVGAYCLEQELILKRQMRLPNKPAVGDLVCFVNTAGYMSHFYESQGHLMDLAKNVFFQNESELKDPRSDKY